MVEGVIHGLRHQIKEFKAELYKEESNIMGDVLLDTHTNFLVRALSDTVYKGAITYSGDGWVSRWYDRFLIWITKPTDDNPFRQWAKATLAAIDRNNHQRTSALKTALHKDLSDFVLQFERLCVQDKVDDPATKQVRAELKKCLPEIRAMFEAAKLTMTQLDHEHKGFTEPLLHPLSAATPAAAGEKAVPQTGVTASGETRGTGARMNLRSKT